MTSSRCATLTRTWTSTLTASSAALWDWMLCSVSGCLHFIALSSSLPPNTLWYLKESLLYTALLPMYNFNNAWCVLGYDSHPIQTQKIISHYVSPCISILEICIGKSIAEILADQKSKRARLDNTVGTWFSLLHGIILTLWLHDNLSCVFFCHWFRGIPCLW